ncbi:hypothetical protein [Thermosipho globiformans]|uniref:hypothetical protein n=1 Tax=Thermosipho globiformans TaxID=380685 RepID=UPI000F8ED82B|nr:hypothetical protein [Thermosipho globiformans]
MIFISDLMLGRLFDIVVEYNVNNYKVYYSKFDLDTTRDIIEIFLSQYRIKMLDDENNFLFDNDYGIFEVNVIKDGLKFIIAFRNANELLKNNLKSKFFDLIQIIYAKFYEEWEREGLFSSNSLDIFLEMIVKNLSEVDAALLSKKINNYFKIKSSYGFDNDEFMKKLLFYENEIYSERFKKPMVVKLDEILDEYYLEVDNKRMEKVNELVKHGNLLRLTSSLSIPIFKDKECVGFLSLYSFESEIAFENNEYISFANVLSKILSSFVK